MVRDDCIYPEIIYKCRPIKSSLDNLDYEAYFSPKPYKIHTAILNNSKHQVYTEHKRIKILLFGSAINLLIYFRGTDC